MIIKNKILYISFLLLFQSYLPPASVLAIDVAPRISDREVIEKLVILEAGQNSLNKRLTDLRSEMKSGQEALRSEMKSGQEALRSEMKTGQEALRSEMKTSQDSLRSEMKTSQDSLRSEMKTGYEALSKRLDDLSKRMSELNYTMLSLFSALVVLIAALFGYIAWDRRTMIKPIIERVDRLERDVIHDLDLSSPEGSKLNRLINAMRELARTDEKVATVLRSFSLL